MGHVELVEPDNAFAHEAGSLERFAIESALTHCVILSVVLPKPHGNQNLSSMRHYYLSISNLEGATMRQIYQIKS
jgi:hypothetical protein